MDWKYARDAETAHACFHRITWTNVFRVGGFAGNPDSRMIQLLLNEFNTLRDEINILKPQVTLFSTGRSYDDLLCQALGITSVNFDQRGPFSIVSGLGDSVKVALRTQHFQRLTNLQVEEISKLLFATLA